MAQDQPEATAPVAAGTVAPAGGGPRVLRALGTTMAGSVGSLVLNLTTGALTARLLEPDGRGTFAAVSIFIVIAATLGETGLGAAATYYAARRPEDQRSVVATAAVLTLGLSAVTALVALALVPPLFAAQPESTLDLARLSVVAVVAVMGTRIGLSLLNGLHQFGRLAACTLAQPLVFLLGLLALAATDRVTAPSALVVFFASYAVVALLVLVLLLPGPGRLRPQAALARGLMGYGVRLQGHVIGDVGNTRLDVALLPAFLAATEIGLYSVAVSAASIVILLFGGIGQVISSLATSSGEDAGMRLVERATRTVLALGAVTALGLGVLAPWLITLVYGDEFSGSALPLRVLLPGCVLWAAGFVVSGGLRALGRPGLASIGQVVGLVVTVAGLAYSLPRYGILGAAVTSAGTYALVYAVWVVLLGRASTFSAAATVDVRQLRDDVRWAAGALRARLVRS